MKNEISFGKLFAGIGGSIGVFFAIYACVLLCIVWTAGSAVTSAVKAGTESCGQTYVVEKVLAGDWFCPEK